MNTTKKITLATLKKFIRENGDQLYINVKSRFDGMVDGCEPVRDGFTKVEITEATKFYNDGNRNDYQKATLGINKLWLVGSSRDYFSPYEDQEYKGIEYQNCCGHGIVAIRKDI